MKQEGKNSTRGSRPTGIFFVALYEGIIGFIYSFIGFSILYPVITENALDNETVAFITVYAPLFLLVGISAFSCGLFLVFLKEWARIGSMVITTVSIFLLYPIGIIPGILGFWYLYREKTEDAFAKDYRKVILSPKRGLY
ncbi:MAG: hypothetical protein ACFFDT_13880 [Candidatus Hodarchaeota archaeon]